MKLAIGVPLSWPHVPREFFQSFLTLFGVNNGKWEKLAEEGVEKLSYWIAPMFPLDKCRNDIILLAMNQGFDALLFLDADQTDFPEDTVVRLVRQLRANPQAGIIAGWYCKKAPPYPVVNSRWCDHNYNTMEPIPLKEPLELTDVVGMGCTLIRLDYVRKLPMPWFEYRRDLRGSGEYSISEDVAFCAKMQAAGYQILTDTSLEVGHLKTMVVNGAMHKKCEMELGLVKV
jgi:hypothetical protein